MDSEVIWVMSANNTLASLYLPPVLSNGDTYLISDRVPSNGSVIGEDGRALPPIELAMGYLKSPTGYIRGGRESADVLRSLATKYASLSSQDRVLEWGCSSGRVIRHFIEDVEAREHECWGVDLEARAIEWAREHLHPILFTTCTTVPHLPFADEYFKLIYGLSVMTHTQHLEDMWLVELRRLVRPGGIVVLTIQDEDSIEIYRQDGKPSWIPNEVDIEDLLGEKERTVIPGKGPSDTFTFFSKKYIHRVWGKFFHVEEIIPRWVSGSQQSAVVLLRQ